jgi:hypothetical protein
VCGCRGFADPALLDVGAGPYSVTHTVTDIVTVSVYLSVAAGSVKRDEIIAGDARMERVRKAFLLKIAVI